MPNYHKGLGPNGAALGSSSTSMSDKHCSHTRVVHTRVPQLLQAVVHTQEDITSGPAPGEAPAEAPPDDEKAKSVEWAHWSDKIVASSDFKPVDGHWLCCFAFCR